MRKDFWLLRWAVAGVVAVLLAGAARAQSPEVQTAFKQGAAALHEGRLGEAEREFRTAARLDPNMPEAHLDLGLVLGREGKNAEAIASLRRAVELNPGLEGAHMFLGVFLYQSGHLAESVGALKEELALTPKNGEALSWLGIVELAAGHPELAAGPLDEAVGLAPDDINLLELRGRAHSQVAQASYSRMAQIDPNAWQVHKVRAELFVADGKDRDAIAEFEAGIKREARNPDLYEGVGDAYRRLNELEQAKKAYARELELAPRNPIAMYNLGSTEIDLGHPEAGIPLLRGMLTEYAGSSKAEYYLGRGLAESGAPEEAVKWLEKSAADDPNGEVGKRSYYELARLYRKLQKTSDADRTLAAYKRLRDAEEAQKAAKLTDWRKLNGPGGAAAEAEKSTGERP